MDADGPPPSEHLQVCAAICEVCGWQLAVVGYGRIGKLSKILRGAGGTAGDVRQFYGQSDTGSAWWWYRDHWLGKRGERPTDKWIRETWGAWNLPIVVAVQRGGAAELMAYARGLRNGDARTGD